MRSVSRGEDDEENDMANSWKCTYSMFVVIVAIVVLNIYFAMTVSVRKNGSIGVGKTMYMTP